MNRRTILSALAAALPASAATRLQDSQVAAPVSTDTRVSIVLPNGTRAYATLDTATLVLDAAVTGRPPVLRALVPPPTASAAPRPVRATFNATANDGTFTWTNNGSGSLSGVFRNGMLLESGVDYEVVSASAIRITSNQGWDPRDTVLVMVA